MSPAPVTPATPATPTAAPPAPAPQPGGQPGPQPGGPLAFAEQWWAMFGLRMPLSGDVVQAIDAALLHVLDSQFGFVNINLTSSKDSVLEQRIIRDVAGYGRQLGRLLDAVDVLVREHTAPGSPPRSEADAAKLAALTSLQQEVEELKARLAPAG